MKFAPSTLALAGAALLAALSASALPEASPASAATPPPTPPPIGSSPATPTPAPPDSTIPLPNATSTPIPIPSGFGLPGQKQPAPGKPTPTPPPPERKGIEGVWEVAIQRGSNTEYTHFQLVQTGNVLSGTYKDAAGKQFPINGSVDGQQVRLIVSLPNGTTALLQAKLDGTSDMIGMLTTAAETTYFTAAWRPKEKWIDNVNAAPGGLGGAGGGPGGGGGAPPPR